MTTDIYEQISSETLAGMLVRMFEFAPIAMTITPSDATSSSYVKVNDAYLRLTGLKWDDIRGRHLTKQGAAIDSVARNNRRRMLDEDGAYVLEEVELKHANGTIIPTLISAQRTEIGDRSYDVEIIVDISARVQLQREIDEALVRAARTDSLSGLPNRAAFDEIMQTQMQLARRLETGIMLAFIDLNGFKDVNDTLGHHAGDEVLKTVASRLKEKCRATDFVARIGGDEFVVLQQMPNDRLSAGREAFRRLAANVFEPMSIDGHRLEIGAAVGIAFLNAERDTPETLLKRADKNMYKAKSSGRAVTVVSDAEGDSWEMG